MKHKAAIIYELYGVKVLYGYKNFTFSNVTLTVKHNSVDDAVNKAIDKNLQILITVFI